MRAKKICGCVYELAGHFEGQGECPYGASATVHPDGVERGKKLDTKEPPEPTVYLQIRDVPADLHKAAKHAALDQGVSLNKWLIEAIRKAIPQAKESHPCPVCQRIVTSDMKKCRNCGHGNIKGNDHEARD